LQPGGLDLAHGIVLIGQKQWRAALAGDISAPSIVRARHVQWLSRVRLSPGMRTRTTKKPSKDM
jgi:hypothetical protein